jgi:hypothetical protein
VVIPCHRLVLAKYDYFRKILQGKFAEAGSLFSGQQPQTGVGHLPRIVLRDADPQDMAVLLECMYTGDTGVFGRTEGALALEPERVLSSLALANRLVLTPIVTQGQWAVCDRLQAGGGTDGATLESVASFAEREKLKKA